MKKIAVLSFLVLITSFGAKVAFAQYRSESNKVTTRVGNPTTSGGPVNIPPISGDPRQAVIDQFGVTISANHPSEYAVWAWELLWRVSKTSFDERVRGTFVDRDDTGSWQEGCKEINIRGTYDQSLFNVVFIHEMGHIIKNCPEGRETYSDAHNTARSAEGPLTVYSRVLCTYDSPGEWERESENYAEMITYYLNPDSDSRTACGVEPNPYANGGHPEHKRVAEQILGSYP
jgi:hypothetical protein